MCPAPISQSSIPIACGTLLPNSVIRHGQGILSTVNNAWGQRQTDARTMPYHWHSTPGGFMAQDTDYHAEVPCVEFQFASADGLQIACARWDSRAPVRGVLQIAHGMGEHIGRYSGLIKALVSAGVTV